MRALLFLVSLTACGGNYATVPRQELAIKLVWVDTYRAEGSPPQIEWIVQKNLNCADAEGQNRGFYRSRWWGDAQVSGFCVAGVYWSDWGVTQIALPDWTPLSKTAFAHELLHAAGGYDPDHLAPEWGTSQGKPYSLYDVAVDLLKANGL